MIRTIDVIHYAYKQAPWRIQRQWISGFLLIIMGLTMIAALYLDVSAHAAITGRDIQNLNAEINQVQLSNANLESQIASSMSNSTMEARALALDYQPIQSNQVQFIIVPGYVPPAPVSLVSAPSLQPSVLSVQPEYTQSLLDWFNQQLRAPISITMTGASQ